VELAYAARSQKAVRIPFAQRPALVRTPIEDREVFAANIENADLPATNVDDLALTRRNLVDAGDDVLHVRTRVGSL
jgi:hypothetical protein